MASSDHDADGRFARSTLIFMVALPLASVLFIALMIIFASPERSATEQPYQDVALQQGVTYATSRRWNYTLFDLLEKPQLQWLADVGGAIRLTSEPPSIESMAQGGDVTILVHGYRTPEKAAAGYFFEFIEYLRAEGHDAPLVVFNWFSTARSWESLTEKEKQGTPILVQGVPVYGNNRLAWEWGQYNKDRAEAVRNGAPALVQLIETIAPRTETKKVNVVAHSMGGRVVLEALRRQNGTGRRIGRLVLMASAVDDRALEDAVTAAEMRQIDKIHVFFSRNDEVVGTYARYAEWTRQLGSHGPRNVSSLSKNVELHDVTGLFGEGARVHSHYLSAIGAKAASLAQLLR